MSTRSVTNKLSNFVEFWCDSFVIFRDYEIRLIAFSCSFFSSIILYFSYSVLAGVWLLYVYSVISKTVFSVSCKYAFSEFFKIVFFSTLIQ